MSTEAETITHCSMCRHPVEAHRVDPETGYRPCRSIGHSKGLNCTECERLISPEHVAAVMELRAAGDPLFKAAFGAYLATRQHVEQEFGEAARAFFTDVHESAVASALIEVRAEIEREIRASLKADLERASEGRASYAVNAPEDMRDVLETEANTLRNAAGFVGGDQSMMLAWLPSRMWTDAEQQIARGER